MDPERVHAYLQVACAGLGFDIGEVWWTSNENGSSSLAAIEDPPAPYTSDDNNHQLAVRGQRRFRFVQLYTSRSYESRRSELVNPPEESYTNGYRRSGSSDNLEKHVLSPRLVDAISKTAQVVWATTKKREGLIGRSDIRLQTAVGMPVAVDNNGNMCVVVMFSPNNIQSTDDAMEYLYSISQSATSSSIPCLLPVFDHPSVGGMKRLGISTSSGFTHRTLVPHPDPSSLGEGVSARFVSLDDQNLFRFSEGTKTLSDEPEVHSDHNVQNAPKDTFGIPMLPSFAELNGLVTPDSVESDDVFDEATYGIWTTIMENNDQNDGDESSSSLEAFESLVTDDAAEGVSSVMNQGEPMSPLQMSTYSAMPSSHPMKECRRERLVEFCQAFLGMSVFDCAEVWVPSDADGPYPNDTLRHVVTVTANNAMNNPVLNQFRSISERTLIRFWTGAVGRAFSTGNPVWSSNESSFVDPGRAAAFQIAQFHTVLAVPVFSQSKTQPTCVVAAYAFVKSGSVPFVLRFVQQALRLLWDGLDRIDQPHVSDNVWQNLNPSDLGEMAADVEMQQHFHIKKRTHQSMMMPEEPLHLPGEENPSAAVEVEQQRANAYVAGAVAVTSSLESIELPDGEIISIPLHFEEDGEPTTTSKDAPSAAQVYVEELRIHVTDAVRSVAHAVPAPAPATQATYLPPAVPRTLLQLAPSPQDPSSVAPAKSPAQHFNKKPHLSFAPGIRLSALPMPRQLPSGIVHSNRSPSSTGAKNYLGTLGQSLPRVGVIASPPPIQPGVPGGNAFPPLSPAPAPAPPTMVGFGGAPLPPPYVQSHTRAPLLPVGMQQIPNGLQPQTPTVSAMQLAAASPPVVTMPVLPDLSPSAKFCFPVDSNLMFNLGSLPQVVGKVCRIHGCSDMAVVKRPYCIKHSGSRQCEHDGCNKCAQGSTRFCIAHGGGRRCTFPGCDKGARDKFFCAAHGGGKRCQYEGGCNKSAVGGSNLCTAHGGGRRCDVPGCGKSAQSSTRFCVKHGGGKKCCFDGCEKVARGRTQYCAAHGGGVRCKLDGCNRVAIGKLQLCRAHGGGSSRSGSRNSNGADSPDSASRGSPTMISNPQAPATLMNESGGAPGFGLMSV